MNDFTKFAIKNCATLVVGSIAAGLSISYAKEAKKEGMTLESGILTGLSISLVALMVVIPTKELASAVSFPTVVYLCNGQ